LLIYILKKKTDQPIQCCNCYDLTRGLGTMQTTITFRCKW